MRLMVVAVCYQTQVDIAGTVWSKQEIAVYVMLFDLLSTILFIMFACWLDIAEENEDKHIRYSANKRFSAADYTVYLPSVPPHDSLRQLSRDLKNLFETVLSSSEYKVHRSLEAPPEQSGGSSPK